MRVRRWNTLLACALAACGAAPELPEPPPAHPASPQAAEAPSAQRQHALTVEAADGAAPEGAAR